MQNQSHLLYLPSGLTSVPGVVPVPLNPVNNASVTYETTLLRRQSGCITAFPKELLSPASRQPERNNDPRPCKAKRFGSLFLLLPAELRLEILEYVFQPSNDDGIVDVGKGFGRLVLFHSQDSPAALLNSALGSEVLEIYFRYNTFRIPPQLVTEILNHRVGPSQLQLRSQLQTLNQGTRRKRATSSGDVDTGGIFRSGKPQQP